MLKKVFPLTCCAECLPLDKPPVFAVCRQRLLRTPERGASEVLSETRSNTRTWRQHVCSVSLGRYLEMYYDLRMPTRFVGT